LVVATACGQVDIEEMIFIAVIAAAVLLSAAAFFFYPRKVEKRSKEPSGTVSCRHCGSRISV